MGMPGPLELGIFLILVIFFFGAGKLPEVGEALGRGLRSLRDAARGAEDIEADVKQIAADVERDLSA